MVLCILVIATIAVSQAEPPVARVVQAPVLAKISEQTLDPAPQYSFAYDIQDASTGDSKSHVETRNGDVVQGQYSLNDPDGTRRIVEYTADPVNGFKAVVKKAPLIAINEPVVVEQRSVVAEPLAARTVVAQPLVARAIAAPLVSRTASLRTAPARLARLEDDSIAVDAVETFPVSPSVPVSSGIPISPVVPVRRIATANSVSFQTQYIAPPVLTYPRIATPLTYALV